MLKTALATIATAVLPATLLLPSTAAAQAAIGDLPTTRSALGNLEAYGLIDMGYEHQSAGDTSVSRMSSGIAQGSRFGMRGREDLGNGYKALFTLEMRVEADSGAMGNRQPIYYCGSTPACQGVVLMPPATLLPAPNQAAILGGLNVVNTTLLQSTTTVNSANAIFDRQAYLGLVTPFGAFVFGRQYTPGYEIINKFNSFHDSLSGQFTQGYTALAIRTNNAIQYRVEKNGFVGSLMYGFGGTDANRNERSTEPDDADDFMGLNLQYVADQWSVGIGHNRNKTATYAAPNEARTGQITTNVGATRNLGPVKFFVQYMKRENKNPVLTPEDIQNLVITTGGNVTAIAAALASFYINPWDMDFMRGVAGATDTRAYHLGAQWKIPSGTLHFSFNQAKDTARTSWATEDAKVTHWGLGYFHTLSLRTDLYAGYSRAKNKGSARMALAAAGYAGGFATAPQKSVSALQLGIRHKF